MSSEELAWAGQRSWGGPIPGSVTGQGGPTAACNIALHSTTFSCAADHFWRGIVAQASLRVGRQDPKPAPPQQANDKQWRDRQERRFARQGGCGRQNRREGGRQGRPAPADILGEARGPPAADDGGTAAGRPVAAQPLPSPSTCVQPSGGPSSFDELLRGTAPTSREGRLAGAREESRQGAPRPRGTPEARTPPFPPCLRQPSLPSQRWTLEGTGRSGWASLGSHGNSRSRGTHSHSGAGTRPARPRPPPPWRCAGAGASGAGRGCSSSCAPGVAEEEPPLRALPSPRPGRTLAAPATFGRRCREMTGCAAPLRPHPALSLAQPGPSRRAEGPGFAALSLPGVPAAVPFQLNSSAEQTVVTHLKCQPQVEAGCPKTLATSSRILHRRITPWKFPSPPYVLLLLCLFLVQGSEHWQCEPPCVHFN